MELQSTFVREIEIEHRSVKSLQIHQLEEGECGCVLWDAGLVLLHYLLTDKGKQHVQGKIVLELGAGTGAVGLAATLSGAACTILTDLSTHVALLNQNISANLGILGSSNIYVIKKTYTDSKLSGCSVSHKDNATLLLGASTLCWGEVHDVNEVTVQIQEVAQELNSKIKLVSVCVLIADCIYYAEGVTSLLKTINMLFAKFSPNIEVLCSFERRTVGNKQQLVKTFLDLLQKESNLLVKEIPRSDMDEVYQSDDISIIQIKPLSTDDNSL